MDAAVAAYRIELPEGSLDIHDLTVGTPDGDAPVVLAVHGITANGLAWQCVADELFRRRGPGAVRFLAPDLRGRGGSRTAPGPYGLRVHADDLAAIADVFGATPLLLGHSMGAYVAALAAAAHGDRVSGLVLVDGGLAFPVDPALDVDGALQSVIGPAMDRLTMRFASPDSYLGFWSAHPALGPAMLRPEGAAVRRYLLHDLVRADAAGRGDGSRDTPRDGARSGAGSIAGAGDGAGGPWVSSCVLDAVRADGADVLADARAHSAVSEAVAAGAAVELVWAERGLLDEPQGLYDPQRLAALDLPRELVTTAAAGVNHYTVILAEEGVTTVVDAVERQLGRIIR